MLKGRGYSSGLLVDGVSGCVLGTGVREGEWKSARSRIVALQSMAIGILPAAVVFLLTCSGESGLFGGALFSTMAAALAVIAVRITRKIAGTG
jgi:hypothetical protein